MGKLSPTKIAISGEIGSGKSSTGRELASQLGWKFLSTGDLQRQIATEMGMTTLELNLHSEKNREIDDRIDQATTDLGKTSEPAVVDSRLGWHFMPNALKIFLVVDDEIAARRISKDTRRGTSEDFEDLDELKKQIQERTASERRRFQTLYNVDLFDHDNYDLIVDTSHDKVKDIVAAIIDLAAKVQAGAKPAKHWPAS